MRIKQILGQQKCYLMDNNDLVPFWELKKYIADKGIKLEPKPEPIKKKRTRRKKKVTL